VATVTDIKSVITGWRDASLPYLVKKCRNGCFESRTGGFVVLQRGVNEYGDIKQIS